MKSAGLPAVEPAYERLAETSPHGLHILTPEGLAYVNPAFCALCGYPRETLLRMSADEMIGLIHPDDRDHCRKRWEARWVGCIPAPSTVYRLTRSDGDVRWVEVHSRHIEYHGCEAVHVTTQDITDRVQAEEELLERNRCDALLRSVAIGMVDHDADRGLRTALGILGEHLDATACVLLDCQGRGLTIPCTHTWLRPDLKRPVSWPSLSIQEIGGAVRARLQAHRAVWCERIAEDNPSELPGIFAAQGWDDWIMAPVFREGEVRRLVVALRTGHSNRWGLSEGRILERSAEILALGMAHSEADFERRQLQTHLSHAQRLESLGLFAARRAGQIDDDLAAVSGMAQLAKAGALPGTPLSLLATDVLNRIEQARRLTSQLVRLADSTPRHTRPTNLNQLIRQLIPVLTGRLGAAITLQLDLCAAPAIVEADSEQLRLCITQLVANAAEALQGRPEPVGVATYIGAAASHELHSPYISEVWPAGNYVFLEITDQGDGMDPAACARFVDPGYSTKGPGRGLGMAVVAGILRQHGAGMRVESVPRKGTRVVLWFPYRAE